jgi:hypothetical protein
MVSEDILTVNIKVKVHNSAIYNSTAVSLYDRIYISAIFTCYLLTVVRGGTGQIHHPIAVARLLQAQQVLTRPSANSVSF